MRHARRRVRAFTMLELLVAVGLMVMLLSVLAFVFQQSSQAVSGATETVTVIQKARNLAARIGKEVGAAVEVYESVGPNKPPELQFCVSNDGKHPQDEGDVVEFLSQTLNDGVMDTWCVRYRYEAEQSGGGPGEEGSIWRVIRPKDRFGENYDPEKTDEKREKVASHVRKVKNKPVFRRVPPRPPGDMVDKMPASIEMIAEFIDPWGGRRFRMPLQFHFPIFQGH